MFKWNIIVILFTLNVFAEDEQIDTNTPENVQMVETIQSVEKSEQHVNIIPEDNAITIEQTPIRKTEETISHESQYIDNTKQYLQNTKIPFEINANLTYSQLNYNMLTYADSILKWRDTKGFGGDLSITANITNKFSVIGGFSQTKLSGGVMSDYDMANSYPNSGVFSESQNMSGNIKNISFLLGYDFKTNLKNKFTGLIGFRQYNLTLNPENIYKVGIYINKSIGTLNYHEGQSQNAKMVIKGLQIGFNYEHRSSENHNYSVFTSVFLPTNFSSTQYNWGYNTDGEWDWKLSSSGVEPFENFGLNVKLQSQVKVTQNIWWNYYAFLNTIMMKSSTEVDRKNNGATIYTVGNAKNARMNQFGIGTGISLR
jgi:hypothetical protein